MCCAPAYLMEMMYLCGNYMPHTPQNKQMRFITLVFLFFIFQ